MKAIELKMAPLKREEQANAQRVSKAVDGGKGMGMADEVKSQKYYGNVTERDNSGENETLVCEVVKWQNEWESRVSWKGRRW
jgi:hypothetical protein